MTRFALICILLAATAAVAADHAARRSAAEIRKEMTAIRRSTDWDNPEQAAKAKAKMAQLAQEMAGTGPKDSTETPAGTGGTDSAPEGVDPAKFRLQLAEQMAEAAAAGKHADVLLAKQVREQIVEEYQADVDPTIKSPEVLAEQTTLVIDFSSPAAEAVVKQMENFRGITTLILTGGKTNAAADVPAVLHKAAQYPLRELYIVDFGQHVGALPLETAAFTELRLLAVYDNALHALPGEIGSLRNLETLLVDANPIDTVLPVVRSLPKLANLGIGKTDVTAAEQAEIRRLRPDCKLLTQ